jgi:hypothetical protein
LLAQFASFKAARSFKASVYSMKTQIKIGNSLCHDQNDNKALKLRAALKLANCALPLKVSLAAYYGMRLPF